MEKSRGPKKILPGIFLLMRPLMWESRSWNVSFSRTDDDVSHVCLKRVLFFCGQRSVAPGKECALREKIWREKKAFKHFFPKKKLLALKGNDRSYGYKDHKRRGEEKIKKERRRAGSTEFPTFQITFFFFSTLYHVPTKCVFNLRSFPTFSFFSFFFSSPVGETAVGSSVFGETEKIDWLCLTRKKQKKLLRKTWFWGIIWP